MLLLLILPWCVATGIAGRRHVVSFLCLVIGIPVFTAIPVASGCVLLVTALTTNDQDMMSVRMGIATGAFCFLSTMMCIFVVCLALLCGSKGQGKKHQYPFPLVHTFQFYETSRKWGKRRELMIMRGIPHLPDMPLLIASHFGSVSCLLRIKSHKNHSKSSNVYSNIPTTCIIIIYYQLFLSANEIIPFSQ